MTMKYQKYLVLAFVGALFLPMLSAKSAEISREELNLNSVRYIETEDTIGLGFDTASYLPENFDPYADEVVIESLNYIEDDVIELGFNTRDFLPEGFDPYGR